MKSICPQCGAPYVREETPENGQFVICVFCYSPWIYSGDGENRLYALGADEKRRLRSEIGASELFTFLRGSGLE